MAVYYNWQIPPNVNLYEGYVSNVPTTYQLWVLSGNENVISLNQQDKNTLNLAVAGAKKNPLTLDKNRPVTIVKVYKSKSPQTKLNYLITLLRWFDVSKKPLSVDEKAVIDAHVNKLQRPLVVALTPTGGPDKDPSKLPKNLRSFRLPENKRPEIFSNKEWFRLNTEISDILYWTIDKWSPDDIPKKEEKYLPKDVMDILGIKETDLIEEYGISDEVKNKILEDKQKALEEKQKLHKDDIDLDYEPIDILPTPVAPIKQSGLKPSVIIAAFGIIIIALLIKRRYKD